MMRLEIAEKDVAKKLRLANPTQQRAASLVACELALEAAAIENPDVLSAIEQLKRDKQLTKEVLSELNALAAQLDEEYFDLQDRSEDDPSIQVESLRLFGQARAVKALSFAGGEDSLVAAMEAIYEASATVDDGSKIFEAVLLVLSA